MLGCGVFLGQVARGLAFHVLLICLISAWFGLIEIFNYHFLLLVHRIGFLFYMNFDKFVYMGPK
jgi:hypothetical protein